MQLYADLNAFESYLDLFDQEEKTVSTLIQLVQQQQRYSSEISTELHQFLSKQLRFFKEEKRRIQLRHRFMESTLNDLRYANNACKEALQTASSILPSDNGIHNGEI